MTRFEERHRELREAADANADDHRGWDQWTTPSESKLSAFRDATEELVDDLVAAVRERQECEKCERTVRLDAELSVDVKTVGCGCDDRVVAALAALDEASGG